MDFNSLEKPLQILFAIGIVASIALGFFIGRVI